MHDQVAADHRQAAVGAVEAHVLGAVAVDDDVLDGEGIGVGALDGGTWRVDQAFGAKSGRGGLALAANAGAETASAARTATLRRRACNCIRSNP